jgi:hypothetical protein
MRHVCSLIAVLIFSAACCFASPTYLSPQAREIVEKMITAHGGIAKGNNAKALTFTSVLTFGKPLETEFWITTETTEIKTERTYQDWLTMGSKLAHDGKRTWTQDWKIDNPPGVNVNGIYYQVALPWLTQRDDVVLEELPKARLGKSEILFDVVKIFFKPESKKSPYRYYNLYIHPETHLLTGIDYTITYGGFLDLVGAPKDVRFLGPNTHIIYTYQNVNGLIFPEKYDTTNAKGGDYGRHIVYNISLGKTFDESRMKIPNDAVLDTSKAERQNQ